MGAVTGGLRATWGLSPMASRHRSRAAAPAEEFDQEWITHLGGPLWRPALGSQDSLSAFTLLAMNGHRRNISDFQ